LLERLVVAYGSDGSSVTEKYTDREALRNRFAAAEELDVGLVRSSTRSFLVASHAVGRVRLGDRVCLAFGNA